MCWMGVLESGWVAWVLRVCAVRLLWSLAGCSAKVLVGGSCLGIQFGLWSVGSGWLLVDNACWHEVWVGGLLVLVGCSF